MINFLIWIIVGGIIGWVASMIMSTDGKTVDSKRTYVCTALYAFVHMYVYACVY